VESTDRNERQRLLADLLLSLVNESGLSVALIGGQAVNYWARPRYTDDFDFTVAADPAGIDRIVAGLLEHGFQVVRNQAPGSPSGPDFVRLERGYKLDAVDLIVAKTEYQDGIVLRAIRTGTEALPIATAEDLIVLKLVANRSKDHEDIRSLLEACPDLDWAYIEDWAEFWGLAERWVEVRAQFSAESD
jgi:hypothetical protein